MNRIQNKAIHAQHAVGSKLADGIHAAAKLFATLRDLGVDDALGWAGLERRHGPWRSIGVFGAGIAVGAGVGILFAPRSGKDTRKALGKVLMSGGKQVQSAASEARTGFHEVTTFS